MLQTAVTFYIEVDGDALIEVACAVPDKVVDSLLQKTRVMERLLDSVMRDMAVPDLTIARCAMLFSQVDERLTQGCDEDLQLLFLFAHLRPLLQPNRGLSHCRMFLRLQHV